MTVRWNLNGSPDSGFAQDGRFTIKIGLSSDGNASVEDQEKRLVVAGAFHKASSNPIQGTAAGWAVFRIKANGTLDRSFGNDGRVTTPSGPTYTQINALALQDDGRILAGGTSSGCRGGEFTIVRLHGDTTGEGLRDPGPIVNTCPGEQPVENGNVDVTIACPLVELSCEGDIVLDAPVGQYLEGVPRNEKLRMGKARFSLKGNTTSATRVKLSTPARRFVKKQKRFKATATITAKDNKGKRRTVKRRVTVASSRGRAKH